MANLGSLVGSSVLALFLFASPALCQARFVITPAGGGASREFKVDNPTAEKGECTEDIGGGVTVTRSWVRDGNDIVIESSPGSEFARMKGAAVEESGTGTMGAGDNINWTNIDFS